MAIPRKVRGGKRRWTAPARVDASRRRWRSWARRLVLGLAGAALTGLVALPVAWLVPLPERLAASPSTVVTFDDGSPAHVFLSGDEKYRIPAVLDEVDEDFLRALLRFEDRRFFYHPGVDPLAVMRAAVTNVRRGRVVSGASTLTLQLARLLEPRPRTLNSKLVEALRAVQLELRLSKEEILAAYLTFAPYGGNVEGVEAASFAYFGHSARDLSADEIATLLAVPQKPRERFPSPRNRTRLRSARDDIASRLVKAGALGDGNPEVLSRVAASPVPPHMRPMPRHAPHAAYWLRGRDPGRTRFATTLDRGAQLVAQRLLASARDEMNARGIRNGALVVVEHATSQVKALVGNFDFFDEENGGQIPGFDVRRSAGSTLKPVIYALAIDRGLVLPEQLVVDVPVVYGSYAPENYDGEFAGLVPLEAALSESLNVPFVRLLKRVGLDVFLQALTAAGVRGLEETPGYYGLSAAIGALELTPLELAGVYAVLARGGRSGSLRWLRQAPGAAPLPASATPIFAPGAAYLTRRALSLRDRPDFPRRRSLSGAPRHIHWKTGTSYGHRDAWSVGSGPRHTAVVWLGNFDNRPSVDLVGSEASGPLLFDLLEALADRSLPAVAQRPTPDLKPVEVCAYSGYRPTPACDATRQVLALGRRVPHETCSYHVAMDVDLDTGLSLNPTCRGRRRYETRTYLHWPSAIRGWLEERHRWLPSPPPLAPGCRPTTTTRELVIVSPAPRQILRLLPGVPASHQEVPLAAASHNLARRLSWFIDGKYLGTVAVDERLWWTPTPGAHELYVVDETGLSARRELKVQR